MSSPLPFILLPNKWSGVLPNNKPLIDPATPVTLPTTAFDVEVSTSVKELPRDGRLVGLA